MTFPILKLPILAVEHILHQFDDCDLQSSSQWIDQEKDKRSRFEIGYFKQNTGRELEMSAVASHILNVFINCKQTSLHIDFGNLEFDLETFLGFIDQIENLTVSGNSESCQNDIISILENVRVTKFLISETLITNPEVLLYLNTPRVEIKRSTLNSDDIVKFLLKWKNSDREMNKIEIVIIHSTGKITTLDYQKLDAKPWDPKKREKVYRNLKQGEMDCSRGMDIENENGLLGTILMCCSTFWFVIWHQRFRRNNTL
ncbi:hypothetical protein CAEBREN_20332 [Caenorhabditis brenneri]|uniref:F-box associated domain-containing protein n=1 Tax=Caenorhabditis brenneri TaxID=135651 RepID=G0MLN0_CAEBE|nr:hypothetical protein CAEBREN_20332 [Caenorhabditis brenneri]